MSETQKILCAKCNVPLQGPSDANADTIVRCPNCGISDTVGTIMKEVAQQMARDGIGKTLSDAAKRSKHLKYTPDPQHKQPRRFKLEEQ